MSGEVVFQVSEIIKANIVWGRNCGSAIKIDTCFNKLQVRSFKSKESEGVVRSLANKLVLQVNRIECYQKNINELPRIYTGGLVFDTNNIKIIEIELNKLSKNEYLELIIE